MAAPLAAVLSLVSMLSGCTEGPPNDITDDGSSETGEVADTTSAATLSGTGPVDPTTGGFETTTDSNDTTTDSDSGAGFIYGDPDGGDSLLCDLFTQDCPEGEKCMPWANDGGNSWNATRCSPIAGDPGQPGDPCIVEGSATSGIDDCELGAMCWDVDSETNAGTCVSLCTGSEDIPWCDDPDDTCAIFNDGVLPLCLPACDPILQDCMEGLGCYVVHDEFVCVPHSAGKTGAYGDACSSINDCDPGLLCLGPDATPGCVASCCTEICDLSDPVGAAQCTGAPEGQQCEPFYDPGSMPGSSDIGVCTLP